MFRETKSGLAFVLPAFALLLTFKLWPIGVSIVESLMHTGITGTRTFVGLENYAYLFKADPVFWSSFKITLVYSLIINPLIVLIALGLALLLNTGMKFVKFFRTLYFLPSAISYAVVAVIWGVIFDPYYGLANSFLRFFNLKPQPYFSSPNQALLCIVFLVLWRSVGYWMMFYLAGLQGISEEIYEAASIDGAGRMQKLWRITIPLLKRTTAFILISNTAFNFLTFAPVYILTNGGPQGSTNLLMYESFKSAFVNLDMGRASAISTILLLIIFLISMIELKLTKTSFEY
ncbi:MAG TPA: sugar ABC transporter permease [Firmicutes bacterium]|nr:sugar ABC transporter permease [Bacillota bacterium]HBT15483.1 sugar ABC transporter permease [Bacillota bacterium]